MKRDGFDPRKIESSVPPFHRNQVTRQDFVVVGPSYGRLLRVSQGYPSSPGGRWLLEPVGVGRGRRTSKGRRGVERNPNKDNLTHSRTHAPIHTLVRIRTLGHTHTHTH